MAETKAPFARHELPESDLAFKREVARRLEGIINRGDVQWVSEITLATGATSTTFEDERVTTDSQITLQPTTPEAAAILSMCWIQPANLTPGTAWSGTEIGTYSVNHPSLVVGQVASFRSCVKG